MRFIGKKRSLATIGVAGPLLLGCDWTAFDALETDAPVVLLQKPSEVSSAFGGRLAAAHSTMDEDSVRVLVGNLEGGDTGARFEFGTGQAPKVSAEDSGACRDPRVRKPDEADCLLASSFAGMATAKSSEGGEDQCFAVGVGRTASVDDPGVVIRCQDSTEDTLVAPDDFDDYLDDYNLNKKYQPIFFAADRGDLPALIVGAPLQSLAWAYLPDEREPAQFVPPRRLRNQDTEFGGQVSVLRLGAGSGVESRLYAVAAPAVAEVWLFRGTADPEVTVPVGCLSGAELFGRTMTAGRVNGDAMDDLVIADKPSAEDQMPTVTVISGAALANLPPTVSETCSTAALLEDGLLASFTCGSDENTSACDDSDFGVSLAVGDVDGDGDGEVAVGAPGMNAREVRDAGAVLLYDVEGDEPERLTEALFLTSAAIGDRLGTAVVAAGVELPEPDEGDDSVPPPRIRDTIVAGGPAHSRVAAFYCNTLIDEDDRGRRCFIKE